MKFCLFTLFNWLSLTIYSGLLIGFCALSAFGKEMLPSKTDELIVAFSTRGADRYADGTPVRDGEKYALVYVKNKSAFKGLLTSGQLVDTTNNVLVYCEGLAKEGRCPFTEILIKDDLIKANGSLYVILLDTRAPDGSVGGGNIVLGYGVAGAAKTFTSGKVVPGSEIVSGNLPDGSTQIDHPAQLPADIPPPVITSIQIVGGVVNVTFINSRSDVYYTLAKKNLLQDWTKNSFNGYRKGGSRLQEEITISTPVEGSSQLLKLVVPAQQYN
jgi:hypothetical protein